MLLTSNLSLSTIMLVLFGALILYMIYSIVIKPLYLIRYYGKQGAYSEYFPVLGCYGKNMLAASKTGDMLGYYKRVATLEKPETRLFASNMGSDAFIFLVDPALIKEFISNQEGNYVKAPENVDLLKETLGNGLATSEGKEWKKHRKVTSNAFHFEFIKETIPIIVQTTQEVLDSIAARKDKEVNILQEFQKITGEITGRIFFGHEFVKYSYNNMALPLAVAEIENRVMREGVGFWNNLVGSWFIKAGILPHHRKLMKDVKGLRKFCRDFVLQRKEQRKKERSQPKDKDRQNTNLLDILLDYQETSPVDSLTDDEIVDEFLTFFFAGTDTIGHTLTMAAYYLTQNPNCYQESLREATQVIKNEGTLTMDDVDKMKYTLGVLKETLRMANPGFMLIIRKAVMNHKLKDLKIKKGTRVSFFTSLNCLKSEYFDYPNNFEPERWLPQNENNAKWKKELYSYLPFSSGPRNCIGQHFALLEGRIILGMLLKRFEMRLPEDYKLKMSAAFMYGPIDPLTPILTPRVVE